MLFIVVEKGKGYHMEDGFRGYNRFLEGDDDAFGATVSEYANRLLLYINRYLQNLTAAEDVMEDVFAELIIRRKKFDSEKAFKAYLFKAARNKSLNALKKESRFAGELPEDAPDEDALIEEQWFSEEKKQLLHLCLRELKDDYREALYLVYFEQLSYEQAAKVMRKSKKQIDNLVQRAKAALKTRLEHEDIYSLADL